MARANYLCGICAVCCLAAASLVSAIEPVDGGAANAAGSKAVCRLGDACKRDHVLLALPGNVRVQAPQASSLLSDSHALALSSAPQPSVLLSQVRALAVGRVSRAAGGQHGSADGENSVEERESGTSAEAMATILGLLESDILSEMRIEHDTEQEEIEDHVRYIRNCADDLGSSNATLGRRAEAVKEAETDHSACRGRQGALLNTTGKLCRDLHTHLKTKRAEHACQLSDSISAAELWDHMVCVDAELEQQSDTARALFHECNTSTHSYSSTVQECNRKAERHNELYCNLTAESALVCSTYASCHARESQHYQEFKLKVQRTELARQHQALAVDRIQCYVRTILHAEDAELAKEGEGEARLAKCDKLADEAPKDNLTIAYPEVPDVVLCPWRAWVAGDEMQCKTSGPSPESTPAPTPAPSQTPILEPTPTSTPAPTSVPTPAPMAMQVATASLIAYFNTRNASSVALDENGKVESWLDLSGNGNHLSQASAGKRPSLTTEADGSRWVDFSKDGVVVLDNENVELTPWPVYVVIRGNFMDEAEGYVMDSLKPRDKFALYSASNPKRLVVHQGRWLTIPYEGAADDHTFEAVFNCAASKAASAGQAWTLGSAGGCPADVRGLRLGDDGGSREVHRKENFRLEYLYIFRGEPSEEDRQTILEALAPPVASTSAPSSP